VPDTSVVHTWEIAGASHVGRFLLAADKNDFRAILGGILERDIHPQFLLRQSQCVAPIASDVETWAVYSAAYAALDRWVSKNVEPMHTEPIQVSAAPPAPALATIVRDPNGHAIGGIRLPKVAIPTALNAGENRSANEANELNGFCVFCGTHHPFDADRLKALYLVRAAYERDIKRVVADLVKQGLVLEGDAETLIHSSAMPARTSTPAASH